MLARACVAFFFFHDSAQEGRGDWVSCLVRGRRCCGGGGGSSGQVEMTILEKTKPKMANYAKPKMAKN